MDSYQAVYDAVRSRISNGDIGQAVADVMREANVANHVECAAAAIAYEVVQAAQAYVSPSAIYRPSISIDGNQWCALYGDDIQNGVAGFGDTPAAAMRDFDEVWNTKKAVSYPSVPPW